MIVDIVYGFLGSGKTTFITRILREWEMAERTVVLVNEFGEVGIDGDLLAQQGGNVVEMPSGCICCTLQADFRAQMLDIVRTIQPERVIIEPTGVATINQVRSIAEAQLFEDVIQQINDILIADAASFMELYKANRHFVENQVKNAKIVLLNKCDKVDAKRAMVIRSALSAINPDIAVFKAEFGAVDRDEYQTALATAPRSREKHAIADDHDHESAINFPMAAGHEERLHFHEEQDALGYESYGCVFEDVSFDPQALETLFLSLNVPGSSMGQIVRAKGIFRTGAKGVLMELASGEFSSQPMGPLEQSKVSIIGKRLQREQIGDALKACTVASKQ